MYHRNAFPLYLNRLVHQTIALVTGFLGYVTLALLDIFFPGALITWAYYLLPVALGVFVGSYLVFVELLRDHRSTQIECDEVTAMLRKQIADLENRQPRIRVGFQDGDRRLTRTLRLCLAPLPPEPDYDALVQEELCCLSTPNRPKQPWFSRVEVAGGYATPNQDYDHELVEYAVEYRAYLKRRYEYGIAHDRNRSLTPVAENVGDYPANNVTIEYAMPQGYRESHSHQLWQHQESVDDLRSSVHQLNLSEDELATLEEMLAEKACGRPSRPKQTIDLPYLAPFPTQGATNQVHILEQSTAICPQYEERQGTQYIRYHIDQLVQHQPHDDFEPFYAWLGDIKRPTTWEILVRVTSASLQKPQEEVLHIDITIGQDPRSQ